MFANTNSDGPAIPYFCNAILSQYNNVGANHFSTQIPSDMSTTMSTSSDPGSPESLSMAASPSMSVTLSPNSMENLLGMPAEDHVRNNIKLCGLEPYLVIREQPVDKYRFRYKSEMMGSHGCMMGRNSDKRKKYFPSVELMNFKGTGIIRCSLYNAQKNESLRTLHCHRLVVKVGKDDVDDPHEIPVDPISGYIAVFRGMGIIHTAKKHIADELVRKKRYRLLEMIRAKNINTDWLSQNDEAKIRAEAEMEARTMNLNVVTLGFEAYLYDDNGVLIPICKPVFSELICNMKSALTGELKICRIDRHFSTCIGGDEVWMLVEKVGKKNIKVKFYEMDDDDNEIWCDFGKFTELDVHHQYAIVFRTPPYRSMDIEEPKDVLVQLYRPTDGGCSEPITFTYRPSEKFRTRKRPRVSSGDLPSIITNGMENGFNPPRSNYAKELQDKSSNPLLGFSDGNMGELPDRDLLQDIDMMSVTSTTIEQILEEEGMESAEFKEFMQNLSIDGYLNTFNDTSSNLVTDSARSKNTHKVVRSKPFRPITQLRSVNLNQTPPTNDCEPPHEAAEVCKVSQTARHMSGDQLLQIVVKRLSLLMDKKPLPSSTMIAESIRDLFEKTTDDGDCALHVAVKPENKMYLDKILSIIIQSRTIESDSVQMYITEILDSRNKKRETPLHRAVFFNQPATVAALLMGGASPNFSDVNGFTPLHIAVLCSFNECLKQLLNKASYRKSENQLYLNIKSEDGFSPLHLAVRKKNIDAVRLLVAAEADINEKDQSYGRTALHIAVEEESAEILKFLVSQPKIRVNEPNFDGNTPLHLACVIGGGGSTDLCNILINAKANPKIRNFQVDSSHEDDTRLEPEESSTLVIVKQELEEVEETHGQTCFDLASENHKILAVLRESERTPITIKEEPEEDYDLIEPKEESEISTELFDSETLSQLCTILDRSQGWRLLAELMDYSFLIASIGNAPSPSRLLFNYADIHERGSVDRIRESLSVLDENEAVKVIDEMLTRRFIAANDT